MPDEPPEVLRRIEQRLSLASDAAERLISEAARATGRPPPAGWQVPRTEQQRPGGQRASELELLLGSARLLGELVPSEVLERLAAALREVLLALRALIDFYLERLERPRGEPGTVQDIPIE
jgi:hypothetical protein